MPAIAQIQMGEGMGLSEHAPVPGNSLPPVVTITGISLSGNSFNPGDPSGTVVGAISVQTTGGAFTGTMSGPGGADAASFAISSAFLPSNLTTSGNACPGGPCTFNITLTANQVDAVCGIPACTQAFVISATSCNNSLDFSQSCNSGLLAVVQ